MKTSLPFSLSVIVCCLPLLVNAQSATTLLCEAKIQGQVLQRVLKVVYSNKTINGEPARFSDVDITWTTADVDSLTNRAIYLDHHLNRLSGIYYADSRGGNFIPTGPPTSFLCRKAPSQKF